MNKKRIDPITLEILTHKLWQVTDEAGITLRRICGSVIVTEAKDMFAGLCDAEGNIITCSIGVAGNAGIAKFAISNIIDTRSKDQDIYDGDVFFTNDPYVCSLHQADAFVAIPLFYDGQLISWSLTMTHLVDIGGADPGGFTPSATNVFQEGIRVSGLKIFERGKIRRDVIDALVNMTRNPALVELDLRAQMAAGAVMKRRVGEVIERYGIDTFKEVCQEIIKYAEKKVRARLAELPDGTWQSVVYMDNDTKTDKARKVLVTMTKEGDSLTFDYTGTDEQAPSYSNVGEVGARGSIFSGFAPFIAYDLPWCQGIINPLNIILPKGTLVRSSFPAACSMGSLGGGMVAVTGAVVAISKMLNSSEEYKELDVTALWGVISGTAAFAGVNQYGTDFVVQFMDQEAPGGGARPSKDGLDNAGHFFIPGGSCPNVEAYEVSFPILYLYRRQRMDSGGMGKFRGGTGGEFCLVLHDAPTGEVTMNVFGYGCEAGTNQGICGGYPGAGYRYLVARDSDINERLERGDLPKSIEELKGDIREVEVGKLFNLKNGDAFYFGWSGGGGYGDPIDRDTELVRKDIMNKLVSIRSATEIHGVVINPDTLEIDIEKTKRKREEIRKSRLTTQKDPKSLRTL